MATVGDLKAVVKDTLEKRGVMGQLKARVRAEVFEALDDRSEPKPVLSPENLLINELIREYLAFNKYSYTSSVLTAETGLSEVPLDRSFLTKELNVVEDLNSQSVPILYGIVAHFLKEHEDGPCQKVEKVSTENHTFRNHPRGRNTKDTHSGPVQLTQTSTEDRHQRRHR